MKSAVFAATAAMQLRFGQFTLDAETRQLLRGEDPIHISPKAFALLRALVEARPRVLSKSELHARLWPDTFVSDANLAILIREIRNALEDQARAPKFVRTIHGFGYAFSGTVVEIAHAHVRSTWGGATFWLIWNTRKFTLVQGDNLVGRSPEADVWLNVPGVSREHARLRLDGSSATIEDLGSRNGTLLAGKRITAPVALQDGDQIRVGPVAMTFRVWLPGAGTKTEDLTEAVSPASSRQR